MKRFEGGDKMQREGRTLWWLAQGILLFAILVVNKFVFIGWISMLVHIGGAIYSQFIQEEGIATV